MVDHLLHSALAQREQLREHADVLLRRVDREPLDRLVHLTADVSCHNLRLAHRKLEALAPHQLDEHGQLKLAASLHLPRIRPLGRNHAQRDIADQLRIEPALDLARSQSRSLQSGERRRVDADRHRERRLVDLLRPATAVGRRRRRASRRSSPRGCPRQRRCHRARPPPPRRGPAPRSRRARSPWRARRCRPRDTTRFAAPCGSCRCGPGRSRDGRHTAMRRDW